MRVKETITMVGKEALTKANNPCKYHGKNIEDGKENLENLQTDVIFLRLRKVTSPFLPVVSKFLSFHFVLMG